jgi:ribonuclease III
MSQISDLQGRMGVTFSNEGVLRRALTHSSYINEHPEELYDNEQLEFLGDAVLDFLIAALLYNRFPEMKEGDFTTLRSALVRTERLAAFARQIDLGPCMRLGKGEREAKGQDRESVLCSTFEAVIGALYLDQGIPGVKPFVDTLFTPVANAMADHSTQIDPKSQFQIWAQEALGYTPRYNLISQTGPDHDRVFTVEVVVKGETYGTGQGRSKKQAEQAAALEALKQQGLI